MESPRLWPFENRLELLGIVLLVYAFLLSLLEDVSKELREVLLRLKCHRTALPATMGTQSPLGRLSPNSWEHFPSKFGDHSGFGIFKMLKGFRKNSG